VALVAVNAVVPTHAIKATFDNVSFMDILQPRFGETGRARARTFDGG